MNQRCIALAALVLAGPALAACSGSGGNKGPRDFAVDGAFSVAVDSDPGDLNPLVTNLVNAQIVGMYSYDTLISLDTKTSEPQPFLAESWTESPSEVTYTLRNDITCADGTSFTAQTAADNLNWILDPVNQSPRLESVVPSDATVTAEGNVLKVTTTKPRSSMLYDLGGQQMVCEGALADPTSVSAGSDGTGPFVIDKIVAGDSITLTRRDGYTWGPKDSTSSTPGMPKTVTIKIVPSPSTRANLLLSGQLNAAMVSGNDEARLSQLDWQPSPAISGMITYNHLEGLPTAATEVRTALTQAIDLDTLTNVLTGGKGERASSLLTEEPSLCTYNSVEGTLPTFDGEAAARTLEAAGYTSGAGGVRTKDGKALQITLVYDNSTDTRSAAAEYVAKQWKSLGAEVTLQGGDESYVISSTFSSEDPSRWTATLGLNLQSGAPGVFPQYLTGPTAPEGTNFASIRNDDYARHAALAVGLTGDAACGEWAKAEEALFKSVDLIPVSVTPFKMYFNGAESVSQPVGGILPGSAIRVLI
ncbi:ABC transporter substrate-binding protein [Rhodococcus erythropolis]|uniref:ABC transporter substrate-binding protein n=1 Tax=Rhodococcus erythropolis TaxID=1833 RepID=UPI003013703C